MLGLMGFSGSLPLYVIHRYYIFVFIDRPNKDACLLACLFFIFFSQCLLVLLYACLIYIIDIIMGRQLDRLMPLWQPANILHSVLIFMLLWQINIVVVVGPCFGAMRTCLVDVQIVNFFHATHAALPPHVLCTICSIS